MRGSHSGRPCARFGWFTALQRQRCGRRAGWAIQGDRPNLILDAARDATIEHWRDTAITHVAERVGAPTGSIYHRFPSRDALFGSLLARSIRRFHQGLIVAAEIEDPRASMAAMARHIPQFCGRTPVTPRP